jgi:hypothetical protein
MQYEPIANGKKKEADRDYKLAAYNLPYRENKVGTKDEAEVDPYLQIFLSQTRKLSITTNGVVEYSMPTRRKTR